MDRLPLFDYDPAAFPQLAPLSRKVSSLGLVAGAFAGRRAAPIRWLFSVPDGTGDLANLRDPVLATAQLWFGDLAGIDCNNRTNISTDWRLDVIVGTPVQVEYLEVQVVFSTNVSAFKQWSWLYNLGAEWYQAQSLPQPSSQLGAASGAQNGPAILFPVEYWRDLR